jgi:hypothetical protein
MELVDCHWSDLKARGFVVIRGALSASLMEDAERDASAGVAQKPERDSVPTARPVAARFREELTEVARVVHDATGIRINVFQPFTRYHVGPSEMWHSDPPPYYLWQDFSQYYNFWIPIIKPRKDLSGLRLLPMDVVAERDPRAHDAILGRGSAIFLPRDVVANGEQAISDYLHPTPGTWCDTKPIPAEALIVERNGRLEHVPTNFKVDDVAVTPDTLPGDIVLARGDVMHRGQDRATHRVALTLRGMNGDMALRRDFVGTLSNYARRQLLDHFNGPRIFAAFDRVGSDTMRAHQLVEFLQRIDDNDAESLAAVNAIKPKLSSLLGLASS